LIVVDSSVWIDYFGGKNTPAVEKLDSLLGQTSIAAGDLMLVEVLQGFRSDKDFQPFHKHLKLKNAVAGS